MKSKDSTEKDTKTPTDAQVADVAKPAKPGKELTDAEMAAVSGGHPGMWEGTKKM